MAALSEYYIVAPVHFWNRSIPSGRGLTCGRVRFTSTEVPLSEEARRYDLRAEAFAAADKNEVVILVSHLLNGDWYYGLQGKKHVN